MITVFVGDLFDHDIQKPSVIERENFVLALAAMCDAERKYETIIIAKCEVRRWS